jgi:heme exporter protein C
MTISSTTDPRARRRLTILVAVTAALMAASLLGIFLVAPVDTDQGIIQKIFYFHVSVAIASFFALGVACVSGIRYLRSREERHDEIGSISVGIGLGFAILVVITGSIWARASWGTWWVWEDPRLVTFLIVLLLYASYFVLRSSLEGERRMRFSAVYAVIAFASVPLSFYSVRVAQSFVHPVVFTTSGADMPNSMLVWFVVSQVAFLALFAALLQFELIQRRAEKALGRAKARLEVRDA